MALDLLARRRNESAKSYLTSNETSYQLNKSGGTYLFNAHGLA